MADTDQREGTVPFKIPHMDTAGHTYYKIIGDLSSNSPRLVVLHGGPGTVHEYLLSFSRLWQQLGIPVVFYDNPKPPGRVGLDWQEGNVPLRLLARSVQGPSILKFLLL